MNFSGKINKILFSNLEDRYDVVIFKKIKLLNIFMSISLFFLLIFLIIGIVENEQKVILTNLIAFPVIFIGWIYFYKTKNYKNTTIFVTIVYTVLLIGYLITGGEEGTGLLWFFPFPLFITHLYDYKKGLLFSLISIIVIILVFVLPIEFFVEYKVSMKLRFVGSYFFIIFVVYFVERISIKMREQAEQKMLEIKQISDKRTEIIKSLSYESRSKINNLLGYVNFLEKTELSEQQQDYIDTIKASALNLTAIIDGTDSYSLGNKNELEKKVNFDIISSLNRITKFYNSKIDIKQKNNVPNKIKGNPIKFKQVFLNILDYYTQNKTEKLDILIEIDHKNEKNYINVEFKILFGKITNNKIKQENTDIGLEITKTFVEKCNGIFEVSEKERYIEIILIIPFSKGEEIQQIENQQSTSNKLNSLDKIKLSEAKILLVEDDEINQEIIKIGLSKYVKSIDVANDGKEALYLYENTKYNLIIMDLQMPIMNGFTTTKKIRETEAVMASYTPIIALTANTLYYNKTICLDAGMDEYITKPFQMKELVKTVEKLICK